MNRRRFLGGISTAVALVLAKVGLAGAVKEAPGKEMAEIANGDERQYWCAGRDADCYHCAWKGDRDVRPNRRLDHGTFSILDEDYEDELKAICEHSTMDMPKAFIAHRSDGQVTIVLHDRRPVWITIGKDGVSRFAAGGIEESPPVGQYARLVRAT